MDISTILDVNHIKLNLVANSKEEAIEELTELLVQDGSVIDKDEFLRDVWQREEEGITGFDNHLAIPHAQSSVVSHTALAIGRTPYSIPWETINDNSHIRCIILFAVPLEDSNPTHIRLLTRVSSALADEQLIAQLLEENDPKNIIDMFNQQADIDNFF